MKKDEPNTPQADPQEDPPPFGRSWPILYAIVLLNLILIILLSYLFTRTFS